MTPTPRRVLIACARERHAVILHKTDGRGQPLGAMPLWLDRGGQHVLAVTWTTAGDAVTYRLQHLRPEDWHVDEGKRPAPVPPIDLHSGVPVTSPASRIEALALVARAELPCQVHYHKPGASAEWRLLERLALRDNRVVAADVVKGAPRSFTYERIKGVRLLPHDLDQAPRWQDGGYSRGGAA